MWRLQTINIAENGLFGGSQSLSASLPQRAGGSPAHPMLTCVGCVIVSLLQQHFEVIPAAPRGSGMPGVRQGHLDPHTGL